MQKTMCTVEFVMQKLSPLYDIIAHSGWWRNWLIISSGPFAWLKYTNKDQWTSHPRCCSFSNGGVLVVVSISSLSFVNSFMAVSKFWLSIAQDSSPHIALTSCLRSGGAWRIQRDRDRRGKIRVEERTEGLEPLRNRRMPANKPKCIPTEAHDVYWFHMYERFLLSENASVTVSPKYTHWQI